MSISVKTAANYLIAKSVRKGHKLRSSDLKNLLILVEQRFMDRYKSSEVFVDNLKDFDFKFFEKRLRIFKGKGAIKSESNNKLVECLDVVYEVHYSVKIQQVIV